MTKAPALDKHGELFRSIGEGKVVGHHKLQSRTGGRGSGEHVAGGRTPRDSLSGVRRARDGRFCERQHVRRAVCKEDSRRQVVVEASHSPRPHARLEDRRAFACAVAALATGGSAGL